MITQLWNGIAGKLAERWIAQSIPAFAYWLAAWCAWFIGGGPLGATTGSRGPQGIASWFDHLSSSDRVIVVALGLGITGASIALVGWLTGAALRLLEGYWPDWLGKAWARLLKLSRRDSAKTRMSNLTSEYMLLSKPADGDMSEAAAAARTARAAAVQQALLEYPADSERVMPTALGNLLRRAEDRVRTRYGLETILVWPHLWFCMPSDVRDELSAARAGLDRAVAAVVWGTLTVFLVVLSPWALVLTAVVPVGAYRYWVLPAARVYASLVGAAFDVYRAGLYRGLRLVLPADAATEPDQGQQLSQYLLSGRHPEQGFVS
jgi:hypothetical protein